jgi:hypothetical protein
VFKKAYQLYFKSPSTKGRDENNKNSAELRKEILTLKDSMNKKRICFDQPADHHIKITSY